MNARRTATFVALLLLAWASPAAAASWATVSVPTGGFSISMPSTWRYATTEQPKALTALASAFGLTSQLGALKLIAGEPTKGQAYLSVQVTQPSGGESLSQLAGGYAAALKQALKTRKGKVETTTIRLPSGKAIAVAASFAAAAKPRIGMYFVSHGGLEYILTFFSTGGAKAEALFARVARSFEVLPVPPLDRAILSATEVGRGYTLKPMKWGNTMIGVPTLDLCNESPASEGLRTGRLQVSYTAPKGRPPVSNEVVTYVSGGAQAALRDVLSIAKSCSAHPVVRRAGTTKVTFTARRIDLKGVPEGAIAIRLDVDAVVGRKRQHESSVAVYQAVGDTLTAVYSYSSGSDLAEAQRTAAHAATIARRKLGGYKSVA